MVQVYGSSVRGLRRGAGVSERQAARAVLGAGKREDSNEDAVRQFLKRLEERDGATELDEAEAIALANRLGVPLSRLEEELVWIWVRDTNVRSFCGYVPTWKDPARARDLSDALKVGGWPGQREVALEPVSRDRLAELVSVATPGWDPDGGVFEDPDRETFALLATLSAVAEGGYDADERLPGIARALDAKFDLPGTTRREAIRLAAAAADLGVNDPRVVALRARVERLSRLAMATFTADVSTIIDRTAPPTEP